MAVVVEGAAYRAARVWHLRKNATTDDVVGGRAYAWAGDDDAFPRMGWFARARLPRTCALARSLPLTRGRGCVARVTRARARRPRWRRDSTRRPFTTTAAAAPRCRLRGGVDVPFDDRRKRGGRGARARAPRVAARTARQAAQNAALAALDAAGVVRTFKHTLRRPRARLCITCLWKTDKSTGARAHALPHSAHISLLPLRHSIFYLYQPHIYYCPTSSVG